MEGASEQKASARSEVNPELAEAFAAGDGESSGHVEVTHADVTKMKRELVGWKEMLVPFNSVLNWEEPYHPAALAGATTALFLLIWFFEPSVLTTFGLLGFTIVLVDYLVPLVSSYIFGAKDWTDDKESQFESVVLRILHSRAHVENAWSQLMRLKTVRPNVYTGTLLGTFVFLAWIGSVIDNLFLTYLVVLFLVMLPGLRHKGYVQHVQSLVATRVKTVLDTLKSKAKKA